MGGDLREGGREGEWQPEGRAKHSRRNRKDRVSEEEREESERSPLSPTVPVRRLRRAVVDFTALTFGLQTHTCCLSCLHRAPHRHTHTHTRAQRTEERHSTDG